MPVCALYGLIMACSKPICAIAIALHLIGRMGAGGSYSPLLVDACIMAPYYDEIPNP